MQNHSVMELCPSDSISKKRHQKVNMYHMSKETWLPWKAISPEELELLNNILRNSTMVLVLLLLLMFGVYSQ